MFLNIAYILLTKLHLFDQKYRRKKYLTIAGITI